MKIDGNNPLINTDAMIRNDDQSAKKQQDSHAGRADSPRDRVELSTDAKRLEFYEKTALETPDIRTDRVNEIRERLETETYDIKAEEVAEALIRGNFIDESV